MQNKKHRIDILTAIAGRSGNQRPTLSLLVYYVDEYEELRNAKNKNLLIT